MQIYFLHPLLIIFIRGAINSNHNCMCTDKVFESIYFCHHFSSVEDQSETIDEMVEKSSACVCIQVIARAKAEHQKHNAAISALQTHKYLLE